MSKVTDSITVNVDPRSAGKEFLIFQHGAQVSHRFHSVVVEKMAKEGVVVPGDKNVEVHLKGVVNVDEIVAAIKASLELA